MQHRNNLKRILILGSMVIGIITAFYGAGLYARNHGIFSNFFGSKIIETSQVSAASPLKGRSFYIDSARPITALAAQYRATGQNINASLADKIASRPGATWLVGPSSSDLNATQDITEVVRTSSEAAEQHSIPLYVLYAVPNRDACAGYSKGGFPNTEGYLRWITAIKTALQTDSVIILEPDAIAHTVAETCFTDAQRNERYLLLKNAISQLENDKHVMGVYIDAGNPEWLSDPKSLVEPLKKSGIDSARGIAVNMSSFVPTAASVRWAQTLLQLVGNNKGAVIDTSRNGKGAPDKSVTGVARWCNPSGRGIGTKPSTTTPDPMIDAYIWGKKIGESDGDCFGYPSAGQFVPSLALDLARNSED